MSLVHHAFDLGRLADIGDDREGCSAFGMHLAGRLLYGDGVDVGYRDACSLAGKQPAHRAAVADWGVLDVVVLLSGADDEDLAAREAPAAAAVPRASGGSG